MSEQPWLFRHMLSTQSKPSTRQRRIALALVLISQSIMFAFLLARPVQVVADNVRYEDAGWLLASGQGLSLPDDVAADPTVKDWVCGRHPNACHDGHSPTAMYPPGYQVFIGGVYAVTGRSLVSLALANLVLLLVTFVCTEVLAALLLPGAGYWFVMGTVAIYPFLAAQATMIMSDQLHVTLLLASLAALLVMRPGMVRGAMFALLLAAATLTRPYCILALPMLFLWRPLQRALQMHWKEWLIAGCLCALPLVCWTARNMYWFGRLIPFSTTGLGVPLYNTTFEMKGYSIYDKEGFDRFWAGLNRAGGDAFSYKANHVLLDEALAEIKREPWLFVKESAKHGPKLWVSMGREGAGRSRAWPLLVAFLGGLMLLGVLGMWVTRADGRWHALTIMVVCYWFFLLPLTNEARRTLPLRMPLLLLAGAAWCWLLDRRRLSVRLDGVRPESP